MLRPFVRDVTEINESGARERMSMRGGRVEDIKNSLYLRRCHIFVLFVDCDCN